VRVRVRVRVMRVKRVREISLIFILVNEGKNEKGDAPGQGDKGKRESFRGGNCGKIAKIFTKLPFHDHTPLRAIEILAGKPAPCFDPLATGEDETFSSDRLDNRTGEENTRLKLHWI